MAQQRLHSALAPIDVLTRIEMEEVLHKGLDTAVKARYTGVDSARFPVTVTTATGATVNIGSGGTTDPPIGPSEGDVWMVRRILVKSSVSSDTARYVLYRGSTPSDASAFTPRFLLDNVAAPTSTNFTTMATPASGNPASGAGYQNITNQTYSVAISNGSGITAIAVNGIGVQIASTPIILTPGSIINITWTTTQPTFVWSPTQTNTSTVGQLVNLGFYPSNKSILLQPGEQIYAQVLNATVGNQYYIDGEGIRVPAEMKGKVLS